MRSVLLYMGALAVFLLVRQMPGVAVAQEDGTGTSATVTTRATANHNLGAVDGVLSLGLTGERRPPYLLAESDVVEIVFSFTPEFNQTIAVQPDGYVILRNVGAVYACGRTVPEFTEFIRQAYRSFLTDPEVTVTLKEFQRPYFIAAGEVTRPGKYELRTNTTLAEAIAISGGFTSRARGSEVLVFRRAGSQWSPPRATNVSRLLAKGRLEEDLVLRAGDLVFVPQNNFSKLRKVLPPLNLGMYANPTQF